MDQSKLMQSDTVLDRSRSKLVGSVEISKDLEKRLSESALSELLVFYSDWFEVENKAVDEIAKISQRYLTHRDKARRLGLFAHGGVTEHDHMALWTLAEVYEPTTYVESGVFKGSSLHAQLDNSALSRLVCIDPDLSNLKLKINGIDELQLRDDLDFGDLDIEVDGERAIAYFDDHIDSAARILQAQSKGIQYVVFDDSTGLTGVCQRLYPAVPTIWMIANLDLFDVGDRLSWSYKQGVAGRSWRGWARSAPPMPGSHVELTITKELLARCGAARDAIVRIAKLPSLADHLPQRSPGPAIDTSKYIVELVQGEL